MKRPLKLSSRLDTRARVAEGGWICVKKYVKSQQTAQCAFAEPRPSSKGREQSALELTRQAADNERQRGEQRRKETAEQRPEAVRLSVQASVVSLTAFPRNCLCTLATAFATFITRSPQHSDISFHL